MPLSKEEIREKKRKLAVLAAPHFTVTEDDVFTCDECGANDNCEYAFDLYNTHGDCLAEK